MRGSSRVEETRPGTRKDLGGSGVGLPDVLVRPPTSVIIRSTQVPSHAWFSLTPKYLWL